MDIEKLKESFEFSHTSTTPLYMQLASFFKICIQSEVLKIDEQLPTEESISKAYGIKQKRILNTAFVESAFSALAPKISVMASPSVT